MARPANAFPCGCAGADKMWEILGDFSIFFDLCESKHLALSVKTLSGVPNIPAYSTIKLQ